MCDYYDKEAKMLTDNDIIKFLQSMPPSAPLALRDFDRDPRFTAKPSASELWHEEREIDKAIDADIDHSEHGL
jgi:hypothetical protein